MLIFPAHLPHFGDELKAKSNLAYIDSEFPDQSGLELLYASLQT